MQFYLDSLLDPGVRQIVYVVLSSIVVAVSS